MVFHWGSVVLCCVQNQSSAHDFFVVRSVTAFPLFLFLLLFSNNVCPQHRVVYGHAGEQGSSCITPCTLKDAPGATVVGQSASPKTLAVWQLFHAHS